MSRAAFAHTAESASPARSSVASSFSASALHINRPGDFYEQEADRAADQVVSSSPATSSARKLTWSLSKVSLQAPLQRECSCDGECDDCKKEKMLQREATGAPPHAVAPPIVHSVLGGAGRQLDPSTRTFMESRFGHDFSSVRIFNDGAAAESARAVSANAYTVGEKIVFNQGRYSPGSPAGNRLLAHELAHVVQQGAAGKLLQKRTSDVAGSSPQREALESHAGSSQAADLINVSSRPPGLGLQRSPILTPDAAGSCGVCYRGDAKQVGLDAHAMIQLRFKAQYPNLIPNFPITIPGPKQYIINKGLPDLIIRTSTGFIVGEIKPANPQGYIEGDAKIEIYRRLIKETYPNMTFEVMELPPPVGGMEFLDPKVVDCEPQKLIVNPSIRGVYTYLCWPPFSTMRKECKCEDDKERVRVPVREKKKQEDKDAKPVKREQELPDLVPALQAAAAAAGIAALAFLANKIIPQLSSKALGPVKAIASLAAMAVLLASGKAEAKLGPGEEEPILQLFKMMDEEGVAVPADIRSMIANNPDLKAKIEKAMAKGGNASLAQQAINEQILKVIEDHKNELTADDLSALLDVTHAAESALPQGEATSQAILKAIKEHGGSGSGQSGQKSGSTQDQPAKDNAVPSTDKVAGASSGGLGAKPGGASQDAASTSAGARSSGLSKEAKQKLAATPDPVRMLFNSVTSGLAQGPGITDDTVDKYLAIVPSDLSDPEARALMEHLGAVQTQSVDQILDNLKKGIAQIRAPKQANKVGADESGSDSGKPGVQKDGVAASSSAPGPAPKATHPQDGAKDKPSAATAQDKKDADAEQIAKLAALAKSSDFSQISLGHYMISWGNARDTHAVLRNIDSNGVKTAAYVVGKIIKQDQVNKKLTVKITSSTKLVAADGTQYPVPTDLIGREIVLQIPEVSG